MKTKFFMTILFSVILLAGFSQATERSEKISKQDSILNLKIMEYVNIPLTTNLKALSDKEKQMIPYLIEASKVIDELYWIQSVDNKELFLSKIKTQPERRFSEINYGPWDRLNGNKPFMEGFDKRPAGLYFYPEDMTRKEFEEWKDPVKDNQYSVIRRDEAGALKVVRYNELFRERLSIISQFLNKASELAEDPGLNNYLKMRAQAMMTDDYTESDMAWMDMKRNTIDVVIGPIENYDDDLFGIRTSFEAFVLVKDREWSNRLARFATFLPELQKQLPVEEKYKQETPGTDSDLNAYDLIYAAGQANAGSKTIAINLPNDESVQLKKRIPASSAQRCHEGQVRLHPHPYFQGDDRQITKG